jgi:hypothetical protein
VTTRTVPLPVSAPHSQLLCLTPPARFVRIAGIMITKDRGHVLDFSFPIFSAGLEVMTTRRGSSSNWTDKLASFVTAGVGRYLLVALIIAGHVVWLVTRRRTQLGYLVGARLTIYKSTVASRRPCLTMSLSRAAGAFMSLKELQQIGHMRACCVASGRANKSGRVAGRLMRQCQAGPFGMGVTDE